VYWCAEGVCRVCRMVYVELVVRGVSGGVGGMTLPPIDVIIACYNPTYSCVP
jgi:hypothetical protein